MKPAEPAVLLDEQDFEEIDRLLESLGADDGLRLDGAQALLTALVVGPQPIGPEEWLPVILGGEPLGAPSPRLQRLLDLLLRLMNAIEHGLELHSYDPVFAEHDTDAGERAADGKRKRDGTVDVDAHQLRCVHVFGDSAHRFAHLRLLNKKR